MDGSVSNLSGTLRERLCPKVKLAFLPQVKRETPQTAAKLKNTVVSEGLGWSTHKSIYMRMAFNYQPMDLIHKYILM